MFFSFDWFFTNSTSCIVKGVSTTGSDQVAPFVSQVHAGKYHQHSPTKRAVCDAALMPLPAPRPIVDTNRHHHKLYLSPVGLCALFLFFFCIFSVVTMYPTVASHIIASFQTQMCFSNCCSSVDFSLGVALYEFGVDGHKYIRILVRRACARTDSAYRGSAYVLCGQGIGDASKAQIITLPVHLQILYK